MSIKTDILIIGSGIAGLSSALFAAEAGFKKIIILNRFKRLEESNTFYAQGGIVYKGENDSPQLLIRDIYKVGDEAGNIENIKILAKEGPKLVREFLIKKIKVPFDRTFSKKLHFTLEGGHSKKRIIHVGDETGKFIEKALISKLKEYPNIKILTNHTAIDLITPSHHSPVFNYLYQPVSVIGAYVFDNKSKRVKTILSQKTILATGGLSWLFLFTTNPETARGDGIAMAYRAGARILNLEFVQFHPTCFWQKTFSVSPEKFSSFLITESIRGEGAILLSEKGEQFMKKYSPLKDLAPRDEICRAMYQEIIEEKSKSFFLDLTPIKRKGVNLRERFPFIYHQCLKYGVDIEKELIPVFPAAHYTCGGIWVDKNGKTTLENLYAVGEVACTGIHGANRLASTSLLEGLVWAKRCIEDIKKDKRRINLNKFKISEWIDTGVKKADESLLRQDFLTIRSILWNYVGIIRTKKRLERALEDLGYLERRIEKFYQKAKLTDTLIGLRNAVLTSRLLAESALVNKRSRGCHWRKD